MSSGRDVPSLPDTSGISDPHTKRVVDAVVSMLQVRNGDKGNGDAAFLTKASLENLLGTENYSLLTATGNQPRVNRQSMRQDSVAQTIRNLQNQIGGSPLSVYLAQKIGMIDRPTTGLTARVDRVETQAAATAESFAAVQTQVTTLTNSFSATANLVNTIQARLDDVDGANATIEQKFTTLVDRDAHLRAQYTIKVQVGQYVAGFGLLAEDNGNGPSSLFLVRADTFAVGEPGLNAQIPFIVKTTPHMSNGVLRPPGVYIEQGFFGDFIADSGHIGNATVDTLKIAGNAVTVPMIDGGFGGISIDDTMKTVASLTIDWGTDPDLVPEMVLVCAMLQCDYSSGSSPGGTGIQLRLWDGAGRGLDNPFAAINQSFPDGFSGSGTLVHGVAGQLGERTYTLTAQRISGSGNYTGGTYSIAIQGAKR